MFLHHLHNLPDGSLAKEILETQIRLNLPGLHQECAELLTNLPVSDIKSLSKAQWRRLVKIEILKLNANELISLSSSYKKIHYSNEKEFGLKSYISELDVSAARMRFKISTNMVPTIQMNFQSDPIFSANLWTCSGCSILRDTQDHVLICPAYSDIRTGLNLENDPDLVKYFQQIIQFRCNLD